MCVCVFDMFLSEWVRCSLFLYFTIKIKKPISKMSLPHGDAGGRLLQVHHVRPGPIPGVLCAGAAGAHVELMWLQATKLIVRCQILYILQYGIFCCSERNVGKSNSPFLWSRFDADAVIRRSAGVGAHRTSTISSLTPCFSTSPTCRFHGGSVSINREWNVKFWWKLMPEKRRVMEPYSNLYPFGKSWRFQKMSNPFKSIQIPWSNLCLLLFHTKFTSWIHTFPSISIKSIYHEISHQCSHKISHMFQCS